ncbi:MAG: penicillin-binding protein 2 [Candidatus Paceibacterota bacterium]
MRAGFILRIRFISLIVLALALILLVRLYFVQVVHGEIYSSHADRQYVNSGSTLFDRGSIFFEDKDGRLVSGATLKSGFILALDPRAIEDKKVTYQALSQIVSLQEEDFLKRAGKKTDPYEEIATGLDSEIAEKIEALGLRGVNLYRERWRYYPGDTLASHTIGFVGWKGDERSGRYGLERYYNSTLSRDGSNSPYGNFFAEVFANIHKTIFKQGSARAGDVITTIEPSVQLELEKLLHEVRKEWNSTLVGGLVIDPSTGSIYALAVVPNYNLNEFGAVKDASVFSNPLVERVYEMGSIIKPLTMAIGLDTGAVTPLSTYDDKGYVELDGARISNFDGKGRGVVPMQEVLNQSLNTGAMFIMQQTGKEKFRTYLKNLAIDEETGIDLPGEVAGIANNLESPRDIEYATASFGQGIAMTPVATVRALGALANNGIIVTPHVAKRIEYELGDVKEVSFGDERRVFSDETSETITRMLVEVVDSALLGGTVALPNYSIAAKTGTAQIAKEGERGYYEDRFLHSFFGYFPAYDPQFLIFLYNVEPQGVRYASQTLTHPFIDMTKFLINYYEIPPDR